MKTRRRRFLTAAATLSIAGLAGPGSGIAAEEAEKPGRVKLSAQKDQAAGEEIPATEDLMREHGVLNRILLIFEEGTRRLRAEREVPAEVFRASATLVRRFVEDYHEKLEENFIFPKFEKRGKLVELVGVLRKQHAAGRMLTDVLLRQSTADRFSQGSARREILDACEAFIRMYRPHAAREDTVLFPALRKIVAAAEIDELGDQFENEEKRLFGEEGFEKTVDQVAAIEKPLGIGELDEFTPRGR